MPGRIRRGFLDRVVSSYVDCSNFSCGFARVRCPECASEYLVAFSCQTRSFCPSCAAKRAALFGAYLVKERCASPYVVSHSCGPLQLKRALPATTQGSAPLPRGSPMPDSSLLAPWSHFFRRTRDGAWKCITLSSLTSMPHSHQWIGDGSARTIWSGRPGRR